MMDSYLVSACEDVMKKSSASFYQAFRFLSSPRKEAVFVIYAFCRMIDDAVDEPESSHYTLDEIEKLFDELETAEGHFIWPSLRWLFSTFPLTKEPFYKQILGQRMDFTLTSYETMDQLELYCERVAGSVGEMLFPVLHEHPTREIETAGIYLGKAMQIVNIIRDVGEDLQRGRRYIPSEWLELYQYSEEDFQQQRVTLPFKMMLRGLMNLAEKWFEKGMENLDSYPIESEFCIKLAAAYYSTILDVVKANDYQVFTKRAFVSDSEKKVIFMKAIKGGRVNEARSIQSRSIEA